MLLWGAVALFIACIGKRGQFPLHTWLPDAMAGPTPVSSLLHCSTMVVAGVFLVARIYPVFWEGFNIGQGGMSFIAIIAAITIVISALLAFVQDDIKKVLAYSTVGQLGYMMLGLGTGAWLPAVFHIFTHAFFKCCLFLCAGSVSHSGSHHSFDMKKDMGGLRKKMPITAAAWIISTLALTGVFPFAGFWSKDEIIDNVGHNGYDLFKWIALGGAALTAMYMTRATYLTFFGEPRGAAAGEHHPDEEHAEEHEMETLTVGARTLSSAANTGHGSDGHAGRGDEGSASDESHGAADRSGAADAGDHQDDHDDHIIRPARTSRARSSSRRSDPGRAVGARRSPERHGVRFRLGALQDLRRASSDRGRDRGLPRRHRTRRVGRARQPDGVRRCRHARQRSTPSRAARRVPRRRVAGSRRPNPAPPASSRRSTTPSPS